MVVTSLGPNDLLYKMVIDTEGRVVGKIVNVTQNGSGIFEEFGISRNNRGNGECIQRSDDLLFAHIDCIDRIADEVFLKVRLDELLS
jgi:hypothetical protein